MEESSSRGDAEYVLVHRDLLSGLCLDLRRRDMPGWDVEDKQGQEGGSGSPTGN